MGSGYVPEAGDIVWVNFTPQAGHRPAVVLSARSYNEKTNLMICCPTTTQIKGYPFEVVVTATPPSVVLADQVKSLDWSMRNTVCKGQVPAAVLAEVRAKVRALIG